MATESLDSFLTNLLVLVLVCAILESSRSFRPCSISSELCLSSLEEDFLDDVK